MSGPITNSNSFPATREKDGLRAKTGIFLGYDEVSLGYLLWKLDTFECISQCNIGWRNLHVPTSGDGLTSARLIATPEGALRPEASQSSVARSNLPASHRIRFQSTAHTSLYFLHAKRCDRQINNHSSVLWWLYHCVKAPRGHRRAPSPTSRATADHGWSSRAHPGICVTDRRQTGGTIRLDMDEYADDMLQELAEHIPTEKGVRKPMRHSLELTREQCPQSEEEDEEEMQEVPYRSVIEKLMYFQNALRLDISHSTTMCARFMDKPWLPHWEAVRYVLKRVQTVRE